MVNRISHEHHSAEKSGYDQLYTKYWITRQEKLAILGFRDIKTNLEIAEELHISKQTATKHISNVFQKLKIKSSNELTRMINDRK